MLVVVDVLGMRSHIVVVQQGVHIVGALVSKRDLGDSSNWDCKCFHRMYWLVV